MGAGQRRHRHRRPTRTRSTDSATSRFVSARAAQPLRARSSRTNTCADSGSHTTAPSASTRSLRWSRAASPFRAEFTRRRTRTIFDTSIGFTNTTQAVRAIDVAWGGAAGVFSDGGKVTVAATSSGDRRIDPHRHLRDGHAERPRGAPILPAGPSGHGPSAHVLGSHVAGHLTAIGDMYANPFIDRYPGYDPAHIGYVFTLRIAPGQTVALMTFVVKGLSEIYDPRGGFPIPIRDGIVAPKFPEPYASTDARVPAPGTEIATVTETARRLVAAPDVRGLTARQRAEIVNWRRRHGRTVIALQRRREDRDADRGCAHSRRGDDGGRCLSST